jgi:hypothetical protein
MSKALSPFDVSKNILKKEKRLDDTEIDKMSVWMINRIFSNDDQFVFYANMINIPSVSNKMVYDFYYYGIPKSSRYIPYSSKKTVIDEEIRYLMNYYECNLRIAKQYHKLLSKETMKEIVEYYTKRGVTK